MEDFSLAETRRSLIEPLLLWFRQTGRDLPWRRTYNPYHVWISEIMLQQTQMDRGVVYFQRWIARFPSVRAVAETDLQEILKYWEGLGYYARARNLHKAAGEIVEKYGGIVPCNYQQLLALPGVGPYTAAAIASVAGNEDVATVDANVMRVYARLFDLPLPVRETETKRHIAALAQDLLPSGRARLYNQALMDLGGLVCLPKNPRCEDCPLALLCRARREGTVAERPVLGPKKKITTLQRLVAVISDDAGRIYIQQRRLDAVWGGLWEFPGGDLVDGRPEETIIQHILDETGFRVRAVQPITTVVHHYTRYKIILQAFSCKTPQRNPKVSLRSAVDYRWLMPKEMSDYAFPAGSRKILEYMQVTSPVLFAN